MLSQHAAGMQQYKLPGRHQLCMTRTQHAAWHDGKRQTQHSCLGHATFTTVSKAAPPHRHVQKCRQPLRHVATAAAATADMGGPFRLPRVKSPVQLRNLLQPSVYDAELLSLAVPALAAMTLEPLMNVFSAGNSQQQAVTRDPAPCVLHSDEVISSTCVQYMCCVALRMLFAVGTQTSATINARIDIAFCWSQHACTIVTCVCTYLYTRH